MDITLTEHNGQQYKVCNGTYYHLSTDDSMVKRLEDIRLSGRRMRFHWGDTDTGKDWGDRYDVMGTIGRSAGPVKVPLLIQTRRSIGGTHFLDHRIVKITTSVGKHVIYQHPQYHTKDLQEVMWD